MWWFILALVVTLVLGWTWFVLHDTTSYVITEAYPKYESGETFTVTWGSNPEPTIWGNPIDDFVVGAVQLYDTSGEPLNDEPVWASFRFRPGDYILINCYDIKFTAERTCDLYKDCVGVTFPGFKEWRCEFATGVVYLCSGDTVSLQAENGIFITPAIVFELIQERRLDEQRGISRWLTI